MHRGVVNGVEDGALLAREGFGIVRRRAGVGRLGPFNANSGHYAQCAEAELILPVGGVHIFFVMQSSERVANRIARDVSSRQGGGVRRAEDRSVNLRTTGIVVLVIVDVAAIDCRRQGRFGTVPTEKDA
jgi:hypothetical protein